MEPKGWGHLWELEPWGDAAAAANGKGVVFLKPHLHLPPGPLIGPTFPEARERQPARIRSPAKLPIRGRKRPDGIQD